MELINSRILLLLLLSSSYLFLSFTPQASSLPIPQVDPALDKICAKTDNPVLCSSTILPFQHGTADPISALQIEIKACLNRTQEALIQLKEMAGRHSTSRTDISSIKVCQEVYESAVDDLNSATEAIATHDVGTLQTRLSAVITDLGTCDDVVSESPGFKLPFNDDDVVTLRKLASNCMAISTLLH